MLAPNYAQISEDYMRIERAIQFLEQNFRQQPDLKTIADQVGLSEYHFQRLFSRWAGISPKRFLQFLTLEYAKSVLANAQSVLDATYEAGLSSTGRLHDLFIAYEAMTPGDYKKAGAGLTIQYGFHPSPFGECLLAVTERGICGLSFVQDGKREETLADLKANWPEADFSEDETSTQPFIEAIFTSAASTPKNSLALLLKGTPFQLKVWQALLKIPAGALVSYEDIAAYIGCPKAARAVGNAIGRNPTAFLIPCHRVIRKAGVIDKYHWGTARKKALIGWEAAQMAGSRS